MSAVPLWLSAFTATHVGFSDQHLRPGFVRLAGGEPNFRLAYSAVSMATFVPLVLAYRKSSGSLRKVGSLGVATQALYFGLLAGGAALLSSVLRSRSPVSMPVVGNDVADVMVQVLPRPAKTADGYLRITRHPMGVGLTALCTAQLLRSPRGGPKAVFWGGLAVSTMLMLFHQDARKEPQFPDFYSKTSTIPFRAIAEGRNKLPDISELF